MHALIPHQPRHLGIIGGLGTLASEDLHGKLAAAIAAMATHGQAAPAAAPCRLTLDRHPAPPFSGGAGSADALARRKLYLYDRMRHLEACRADGVLVPCFISHTFLAELQAELGVRVFDMMAALARHVGPAPLRIGVLCSSHVRDRRLFERAFPAAHIVYPGAKIQDECVMPALHGACGTPPQAPGLVTLARLRRACGDLTRQGADLIIPGAGEFAALATQLRDSGHAVLDCHQVYAEYALAQMDQGRPATFKLGVVGGIGPAATVDFLHKIIRHTDASRDQDHVRLVVDHNPQIPDRTANLVGDGDDPTLALYSACRRLEEQGASLIAMPCNTAHAYVGRLQPRLAATIVNMLDETVRHIGAHYPGHGTVGLLATSGTVASGVYRAAARGAGFDLIVPDAQHQQYVMEAIYGSQGVKAGYTEGPRKEALLRACAHLARRGASVIILGCTELPLLLPRDPAFAIAGTTVALLDPTDLLAQRCVTLARGGKKSCNID